MDLVCGECGEKFTWRRNKKYCCAKCMRAANASRLAAVPGHGLSPATLGAAHELVVCVDLMRKGFSVYRSVSPSAPFDLVAARGVDLKRVEVTTGSIYYNDAEERATFRTYHNKHGQEHKYDILAIVTHDGAITYSPQP